MTLGIISIIVRPYCHKVKFQKNLVTILVWHKNYQQQQRLRRARIKAGKSVNGLDYDHKTNSWTTIKENRGNRGHGTKTE